MSEQLPDGSNSKDIPFNSDYDTGFGTEPIDIGKQKKFVHNTNNFQMIFGFWVNCKNGEEPTDPFDEAYRSTFAERHFDEIFDEFAKSFPGLYQRMLEITDQRARERDVYKTSAHALPEEVATSRKVIFSKAFDGLAPIARRIDPSYNLSNFCR